MFVLGIYTCVYVYKALGMFLLSESSVSCVHEWEFMCKSEDLPKLQLLCKLCKSIPIVLLNPQTSSDENERFISQRTLR